MVLLGTGPRRGSREMIEGRPGGRPSIELLLERHRVPVPRRVGRLPGRGAQRVTGWNSPGGPASRLSGQPPPGSLVDIHSVGPPPFSGAPMVPICAGVECHLAGPSRVFHTAGNSPGPACGIVPDHPRRGGLRPGAGAPLHYRRTGAGPYRCRHGAGGGDGLASRWRGGPARPAVHGRGGRARHRGAAPPGGGSGHRHREVARLSGSRRAVGPFGRGRHRHPGPPGPARHQGPAPRGRRARARGGRCASPC